MPKRHTYRYKLLRDGRIVHSGITNDPARRKREHRSDGVRFDTLKVVGPPVTRESARKWEGRPQRKAVRKKPSK